MYFATLHFTAIRSLSIFNHVGYISRVRSNGFNTLGEGPGPDTGDSAGRVRYLLNTITRLTRSQSSEGNSWGNSGIDLTMLYSPPREKKTISDLVLMWQALVGSHRDRLSRIKTNEQSFYFCLYWPCQNLLFKFQWELVDACQHDRLGLFYITC